VRDIRREKKKNFVISKATNVKKKDDAEQCSSAHGKTKVLGVYAPLTWKNGF